MKSFEVNLRGQGFEIRKVDQGNDDDDDDDDDGGDDDDDDDDDDGDDDDDDDDNDDIDDSLYPKSFFRLELSERSIIKAIKTIVG